MRRGFLVNPASKRSVRFLEVNRHEQKPTGAGFGVKVMARCWASR